MHLEPEAPLLIDWYCLISVTNLKNLQCEKGLFSSVYDLQNPFIVNFAANIIRRFVVTDVSRACLDLFFQCMKVISMFFSAFYIGTHVLSCSNPLSIATNTGIYKQQYGTGIFIY